MKHLAFHPQAEAEFARDTEFYAERSLRLAQEFTGAVEQALAFVQENPEAGTPVRGALRGWLVRRFPYTVIYREEEDRIYVLALAPHRRRPGYWRRRE